MRVPYRSLPTEKRDYKLKYILLKVVLGIIVIMLISYFLFYRVLLNGIFAQPH